MEEQNRRRLTLAIAGLPVIAALAWLLITLTANSAAPTDGTSGSESAEAEILDAVNEADSGRMAIGDDLASQDDMQRVRGRILSAAGEPATALVGPVSQEQPTRAEMDGSFELLVELDQASVTLLLMDPEHAPTLLRLDLPANSLIHEVGDLRLLAGGRIRGRITDAAGLGLVGATATLVTSGSSWPAVIDMDQILQPTLTNAEGEYAFDRLVPGSYRVIASADGLQSVRSSSTGVEDGVESVMDPMQLATGYALGGRVIGPEREALVGATIHIRNGPGQPRYNEQVMSEADGRFLMTALPPGALRVEASAPGYMRHRDNTVDASLGAELVIQLVSGLSIRGRVTDSRTGEPVEAFAAKARRIGALDPSSLGSMPVQLQRLLESLRASAAASTDLLMREQRLKLARELGERMQRVLRERQERPIALPVDTGVVEARVAGEFEVGGLEEGIYVLGIASPEHQYHEVESIEVRLGLQAPELNIELRAGHVLAGVVVSKENGRPLGAVHVELMRVLESSLEVRDGYRSLYSWFFARSSTPGIVLMTLVTGADGRFEFRNAAPGRSFLSATGSSISDHESEVFYLGEGRKEMRLQVGGLAALEGRVRDFPSGSEEQVFVIAMGGHGRMETVRAGTDGSYRFEGLSAGSYIVRAYPESDDRYVNRLFASIFPLWSGDVDGKEIPTRDVTLGEDETGTLDLDLDRPSTAVVQGLVRINGRPGVGGRAILRPLPGETLAGSGMSFRGEYDELGQFRIEDVPAGEYRLSLSGSTRQELYNEAITVEGYATESVEVDLGAGGLRGQVRAAETLGDEELRGYLWVLPGATEAPQDLYEYRQQARTHRLRIREGAFEDAAVTPGPAVLVLALDGWQPVVSQEVIPVSRTLQLDLVTAGRLQ